MKNYSLSLLRQRHTACISWTDIQRHIQRAYMHGTLSPLDLKQRAEPVCDHPEDGVCASPSQSDEFVLERYKGTK